eukprot:764279-Hanusia_phi.AAC.2
MQMPRGLSRMSMSFSDQRRQHNILRAQKSRSRWREQSLMICLSHPLRGKDMFSMRQGGRQGRRECATEMRLRSICSQEILDFSDEEEPKEVMSPCDG